MSTQININFKKPIAYIDPRIFGLFIEHFPRQIYGGIYQEDSSLSDEKGFRMDVQDAVKELNPPQIRWPGGNYTSGYHWEWGIGPKEDRRTRKNPHWEENETHKFGTDEFIEHCRRLGAEPLICVGVGKDERNPTPEEAACWVRYCNSIDSKKADLRRKMGHHEPFNVKWWGLGNECWGSWQIGHYTNGSDYGSDMLLYKHKMLREDNQLKFVIVGGDPIMARKWNKQLLSEDEIIKEIDVISFHHYYQIRAPIRASYLKSILDLKKVEKHLNQLFDLIEKKCKNIKREDLIKVSVDEWNEFGWEEQEIEKNAEPEQYDLAHALYTAGFLNILLRHSDYVIMANYSPYINTRGLIYVNDKGLLLRSSYYVFKLFRKCGGGLSLRTELTSPNLEGINAPSLDASSIRMNDNELIINIVNRDPQKDIYCDLLFKEFEPTVIESSIITAEDLRSFNSFQNPFEITIAPHHIELDKELGFVIPSKSIIQMILKKK